MRKIFLLVSISTVLFSGCKKDDETVTPTNSNPTNTGTGITANTPSTLTATINGNVVTYTINNTDIYNVYSSSGSIGDTTYKKYGTSISRRVGTDFNKLFTINKGTLVSIGWAEPDTTTFSAFFNPKTLSFSDFAENGMEIIWYDTNNVMWTTTGANQTGSSFVIEKKISYENLGYFYVKYSAKFNCKLTNGTQTISLTNGSVIGNFTN